MFRCLLIAVLLSLFIPCAGYSKSQKHQVKEPIKKQLTEIRKHIKEKKEEIKISEEKAKQILNDIDKLDKQTNDLNNEIIKLNKEKAILINEINDTQKRIIAINKDIQSKKEMIADRIVANFKLHQIGYLQLLLTSESPVDMEKRYTFLNYIIRHDEKEERDYINAQDSLINEQNKYNQQRLQLDALTDNLNRQKLELASARKQKEQILASIRYSAQATRKVLTQLQNSEMKLQDTLKSLESSSGKQIGFAAMEGRLPFPVKGKIEKIFGKTTENFIKSNGVLFHVTADAPVKAVYQGNVVWSEWLKGYGNTIILDHGNRYFTIYAHLGSTDVKVGDRVEEGETIGKVGEVGVGNDTTLYFEIRHGEKPLNPENWLTNK
jgi:septal ring factor EnvC (AmiA/AmiB activator)